MVADHRRSTLRRFRLYEKLAREQSRRAGAPAGQDGRYLAELLVGKGYQVYGMARRASQR